ncbi:hypothetical protein [Actinoplanes sp. NPDC051851]|uniref:hypothetical protein n=1 Tax=Actinoplanes sp. NPDC051851 TaxID=3154753 RepID=UPI00342B76EF
MPINLGAVVVIAVVLATVLRLLDTRLPSGTAALGKHERPAVPRRRSGAEAIADREA